MFNPNNIITVSPQRPWKPLEVTLKETGERVTIKDYRFNPALHEDAKVVGEDRVAPIPSKPVEINTPEGIPEPTPETSTENPSDETPVITPQERFAFLKSKGWKKLDSSERENYKVLKAQLEPKK